MTTAIVGWMDRTFYPSHSDFWDDELFRSYILESICPNSVVLDLGAGAGIVQQMNFKGLAAKVCGIDPDPRVTSNPHLDEGLIGAGEAIPYPDNFFDVVFADNVLEHLPNPEAVFAEIARVLKPGGVMLAKTPNRWHYVAMIASLTPTWFHKAFNRMRGRDVEDTFPTRYRANRRRVLKQLAHLSGMNLEDLVRIEGRPEYLRFSAPTYLVGTIYERIVNATRLLSPIRVVLLMKIRKP